MKSAPMLAALALSALCTPAWASNHNCQSFEELLIRLERNHTDGDAEVVLFAKTEVDGLKNLFVHAPGGRRIAGFQGSRRGVGIREFLLESAEPPRLQLVLEWFPEGRYSVRGTTVGGECVRGTARLSHTVAPFTQILSPAAGAVVAIDQLTLSWVAVPGAVLYVIEIDNEDLEVVHSFELFPPTTSLAVPAALLTPGSAYLAAVTAVAPSGNRTSVEVAFSTAP